MRRPANAIVRSSHGGFGMSLEANKELARRFIDEVFGGWQKAQPEHFNDGGLFDQIYKPGT